MRSEVIDASRECSFGSYTALINSASRATHPVEQGLTDVLGTPPCVHEQAPVKPEESNSC